MSTASQHPSSKLSSKLCSGLVILPCRASVAEGCTFLCIVRAREMGFGFVRNFLRRELAFVVLCCKDGALESLLPSFRMLLVKCQKTVFAFGQSAVKAVLGRRAPLDTLDLGLLVRGYLGVLVGHLLE